MKTTKDAIPQFGAATGSARWKCNKCGKLVTRKLGWKLWTPSYCEQTGTMARLYRVSAPNKKVSDSPPLASDNTKTANGEFAAPLG